MAAATSAANNAAVAAAVADKQAQEQSAPAHLANSVLNLVSLREHARKELNKILDPAKGKRIALVLDSNLSGPLFLVTDRRSLKEQGVERILPLTGEGFNTDIKHIVFLTRPRPELAKMIANTMHAVSDARSPKNFSIYFVPRRTMLCERVLADNGVYGDVVTGEYHLDLIPFDEDVLSLQMPLSFRELTLDGDPTCLFYVARSLMKLQSMFGLIPQVQGKGDNAFHVFNLMRRMRLEMSKDHFANLMPEIHSLILIDRQVDLVTPLLTQLTYEGLIDELLGVKNGHVEIEAELLGKQGNPPQQQQQQQQAAANAAQDKKPVALNSSDPLYKDIRDAPFRTLGGYLHKKAEEIKETYKEKDAAQTVSQMKDFMKKFKSAYVEHNALQLHLAVAGKLSETFKSTQFDRRIDTEQNLINLRHESEAAIEKAISQGQPLLKVLRLLCLLSLTYGIKPKKFDFYRREILHTYGFEMLFTLNNLEKVGLLRKQTGRQVYPAIKKALRLCKEDCDPKTVDPKMFVYDTYTPISARLVEIAAERQGWNSINEALSMIPGRAFEAQQEIPAAVKERSRIPQEEQAKKPLTLVFFLGGVTFAEISAIRNLSERENATREYIVASTQLINGDTALAELTERVENSLRRTSADLK